MGHQTDHPRRARLTVRVGVTGHRDLAGADQKQLCASLEQVLNAIRRITEAIHRETNGFFYSTESPKLVLLSSLAEGTDQIVAEKALNLGYELSCPLPFAVDEYTRKFDEESKKRFERLLPQARTVLQLDGAVAEDKRPGAYLAAGQMILRQSDVLLAVWDGAPAKGVGGTAEIVGEAASRDIPTVWIGSSPPHLARLRSPRAASGKVAGHPRPRPVQDLSYLDDRLRASLLPSTHPSPGTQLKLFRFRAWILERCGKSLPCSEWERARAFFGERRPRRWPGLFFHIYRLLWTGRKRRVEESEAGWNHFVATRPELGEKYQTCFHRHYEWADDLANSCVGKYRDSFVLSYLLGAFAVFFAFFGLRAGHLTHSPAAHEAHLAGIRWFSFELLMILIILAITLFGALWRWHERWMDYRPLAEAFRQMKFLELLGRVPPSSKVPAHLAASDPGRSWFNWYFRSMVRQAGMIGGPPDRPLVFDASYLKDLRDVLSDAIKGQIRYHENNHKTFHALYHRSHLMGQAFFVAAALGCTLHLFDLPGLEPVLSFVAIVLPGFGAALSAILHQGEFERISLRSKTLEGRLNDLLKELPEPAGPRDELSSQTLGKVADTFSDILVSELLDWRFAFLGKGLALP